MKGLYEWRVTYRVDTEEVYTTDDLTLWLDTINIVEAAKEADTAIKHDTIISLQRVM